MQKEKDKKKRKGGCMKKVVIILFIIIVVAAFFLLGGGGFGFGSGSGTNGNENSVSQSNQEELNTETQGVDTSEITVTIKEDKVWVQDKEIEDKDELKSYIESINDDTKTYKLEQDNAILSTYNWVTEVFSDLQITLQEVRE